MGIADRLLLTLFMTVLKTKRIAKSAVNGKINYNIKKYAPYAVGVSTIIWLCFVFLQ